LRWRRGITHDHRPDCSVRQRRHRAA
jgi:hypothetical protein